jgi:predicted transcriptional regulator
MSKNTKNTMKPDNIIQLPVSKKEKRRAEDKFGAAVMKHGYTMLPNLLIQAQGKLEVGHAEFNILVQLISHWWEADKNPHPAKETIARRMGISGRQVQRYLTRLERAGLIERIERFAGHKAQLSNAYSLNGLVHKLAEIEPEFKKAAEKRKIWQRKVESK